MNDDDAWPDVVEEAVVRDTREPDPQRLSDYTESTSSLDPEDLSYLMIMQLLCELSKGRPVVLMLSDKVTSHTVAALGFFIEDRSYRIIYHDTWGSAQSFLEYGKNVAGVAAERYEEYNWSVSHHQLSRVLDSYIAPSRPEKGQDGKDPQN